MTEDVPTGGDGPRYKPYRDAVPPLSSNGHERRPSRRLRALRGGPAGLIVTGLAASSVIPRLLFLNLAFYNPWPRPVFASSLGGIAAGALRRGKVGSAALVGATSALLGLWIAYTVTRAQNPVLFVDRSPLKVIAADLLRLAAYALPAGALGAMAGWSMRRAIDVLRHRRTQPITELPRRARR